MSARIRAALFARARAAGLPLRFDEIEPGVWQAKWTCGTRSVLWCGTLAEVWATAGGAR